MRLARLLLLYALTADRTYLPVLYVQADDEECEGFECPVTAPFCIGIPEAGPECFPCDDGDFRCPFGLVCRDDGSCQEPPTPPTPSPTKSPFLIGLFAFIPLIIGAVVALFVGGGGGDDCCCCCDDDDDSGDGHRRLTGDQCRDRHRPGELSFGDLADLEG